MENKQENKKAFRFPFYVVKRIGLSKKKYWLIRLGGVLLAFLIAGITCTILAPGSFGTFFAELFRGCFDFSDISTIIDLLVKFSILLVIAMILTLAFKMRFWNIGAEGQILIGCLAAAGIAHWFRTNSPGSPNIVILLLCLICSVAASVVWSVIPAIFKAYFNTNETLFTLMLNYIAALLAGMCIFVWIKSGSQSYGTLSNGIFPEILDNKATLVILICGILFAWLFFYISRGKHGYEISVIGESINTARYIGINVKKVTIRTMIVSGVLFGVVGFMIVCGVHRSFSPTIVGGEGFTGVLIAWLGHFNPYEILFFSFLTAVMDQGTSTAASAVNISSSQFSAICTGIFFFIIIACEFFSRYEIKMHHKEKPETEEVVEQ